MSIGEIPDHMEAFYRVKCATCGATGPEEGSKDAAWKCAVAEGWYIDARTARCEHHWPGLRQDEYVAADTPRYLTCLLCGEDIRPGTTHGRGTCSDIYCAYCGNRASAKHNGLPLCRAHLQMVES